MTIVALILIDLIENSYPLQKRKAQICWKGELESLYPKSKAHPKDDEGGDEERNGARSALTRIEGADRLQYREHKVPFPQCKET